MVVAGQDALPVIHRTVSKHWTVE